MRSMTGFSQAEYHDENLNIQVRVRTVNGRFLETRLHLPREYSILEKDIKGLIKNKILRGSLDLSVHRKTLNSETVKVKIQTGLLSQLKNEIQKVGNELGLNDELTLYQLLRWPQVVQVEESSELGDDEKNVFLKVVEEALDSCTTERDREGHALYKDLKSLFEQLQNLSKQIEAAGTISQEEIKKAYVERLKKLDIPGEIDEQRLAQETIIFIDRAAISEEIMRLNEHLKACIEFLDFKGAQGRKFEFYSQELLREVNTIGSKSQKAHLTQIAVEAKSVIEKIREQVQNIE